VDVPNAPRARAELARRPLPGERGREFVLIERRYQSVPQDTLVLVIDVGTP
jgi:hypothetical protein